MNDAVTGEDVLNCLNYFILEVNKMYDLTKEQGWIQLYLNMLKCYLKISDLETFEKGYIEEVSYTRLIQKNFRIRSRYMSVWKPRNFFDLYRKLNILFKAGHKIRLSIVNDENNFIFAHKLFMGQYIPDLNPIVELNHAKMKGSEDIKNSIVDCQLNVVFVASSTENSLGSKSLNSVGQYRRESVALRKNNELSKALHLFILNSKEHPIYNFDEKSFFLNIRNKLGRNGGEYWLNEYLDIVNQSMSGKILIPYLTADESQAISKKKFFELKCGKAANLFYLETFIILCKRFFKKHLVVSLGGSEMNELGKKFFFDQNNQTPKKFASKVFCDFAGAKKRVYLMMNKEWYKEGKPLIFVIILRLLICNLAYPVGNSGIDELCQFLFHMQLMQYDYISYSTNATDKCGIMVSLVYFAIIVRQFL